MKLTAVERVSTKKTDNKKIRREGKIPAIVYSQEKANQQITLDAAEFSAVLRKMKPGHLPTTTFTLVINGKEKKTIVKDIQYQLTTYQVSHVDFEELVTGVPVSVKVPIQ
jgi:large subunit ribosomal protein L25